MGKAANIKSFTWLHQSKASCQATDSTCNFALGALDKNMYPIGKMARESDLQRCLKKCVAVGQ